MFQTILSHGVTFFHLSLSYMYEHGSTMKPVQANLYEAVTLS